MSHQLLSKNVYLFDMDGTLVNTEPVGPQVLKQLFLDHGVKLSQQENDLFLKVWRREGTNIKEDAYIEGLRVKYGINIESSDFLHLFFILYQKALVLAEALPGVDGFLRRAHQSGKKLAVVTSSKRDQAQAVLAFHKWSELFNLIIAEEDISHFKPDPEPYLLAADKLKAKLDDCLVFEDAKNGVVAAKVAGMNVIGLRAGNELEQDLAEADYILRSFEELK